MDELSKISKQITSLGEQMAAEKSEFEPGLKILGRPSLDKRITAEYKWDALCEQLAATVAELLYEVGGNQSLHVLEFYLRGIKQKYGKKPLTEDPAFLWAILADIAEKKKAKVKIC